MNNKDEFLYYYKTVIINNIYRKLYFFNWSLRQLSEEAGLPYETIKKLTSGKINNPSIYNLIKISEAFQCSVDELISDTASVQNNSPSLSNRCFSFLSELCDLEDHLLEHNQKFDTDYIAIVNAHGFYSRGFSCTNLSSDIYNFAKYRKKYGDLDILGVTIYDSSPDRLFYKDELILICKDRYPFYGDCGIFMYKDKIYIRRYVPDRYFCLEALRGFDKPLILKHIDECLFLGRIIGIIKK